MTDRERHPPARWEADLERAIASTHHRRPRDAVTAAISQALARIHRDHIGCAPAQARTSIDGETITVTMRGVFTRAETTLIAAGHGEKVLARRRQLHAGMHDEIAAAIETLTGRTVAALMSANHFGPDVSVEVCLLAPRAGAGVLTAQSAAG